jgi:ABC-type antimicrobial peptide transport system permease subunit
MSRVPSPQDHRVQHTYWQSVFLLASWRLRRTRLLLLFITVGIVAAVVIACAIPLLYGVMTTAGLRSALRSTPDSNELAVYAGGPALSTPITQAAYNEFAPLFHRYLGNRAQQTQFSTTVNDFSFAPQRANTTLVVYGTDMQQAAPYFGTIDGRLAQVSKQPVQDLEVMMTPDTAQQLGLHIGSTFSLSFNYFTSNPTNAGSNGPSMYSMHIAAHLAGLFQVTPGTISYWHGDDFRPLTQASESSPTQYEYTIVVPEDALLALADRLSTLHQSDAIYSPSTAGYAFSWYYRLPPSRLTGNDLDPLLGGISALQSTMNSLYGDLQPDPSAPPAYPYLSSLGLSGTVLSSPGQPGSLQSLHDRVTVARIPSGMFTILILLLILFFVVLITALFVDRHTDGIALLRSRGASRGQVFGALFLQGCLLSLFALLIGIPLAFFATLALAGIMMPGQELDALNTITAHPVQAMADTLPYALVVLCVALLTMGASLFSAVRMDVLSLRRMAARNSKRPLWQRFNLDVIAGALALLGYGLSLYVTNLGSVLGQSSFTLIVTPLSIIAPFFLLLGCLLLFFRVFPVLLRWGARLAERDRGAVALLAFAQITRSPRQPVRMTLLLALATAFTLFTLVYSATEAQHIQEIATYETGADFSAKLSSASSALPAQAIRQYSALAGVLSASAGYVGQGYGGHADLPLDIRAVEPMDFERTVIWPSSHTDEQARPLLSKLVEQRSSARIQNVVPAIVDQTTRQSLLLQVGDIFTIKGGDLTPLSIHCLIVGVIDHIPTVDTLTAPVTTGGVLVDYQTYRAIILQDAQQSISRTGAVTAPPLNQLWLRTKSDAASLENIRVRLSSLAFHLSHIMDRRLILTTLQSDPLYLLLVGTLQIGMITALLLAVLGNTLGSWVSARSRQVSFASLRALGATPRQITFVFLWEQAIIYTTGLLLGAAVGALLVFSVLPQLTFTTSDTSLNSQQFFALQSALAPQITVPSTALLALLVLIGIYGLTLLAMVRLITLPRLHQTLRFNED